MSDWKSLKLDAVLTEFKEICLQLSVPMISVPKTANGQHHEQ
jgi:hypothetical protein